MSCEKSPAKVCQAAAQVGISKSGGKSGFVAGSSAQIAFFRPETISNKGKSRRKKSGQISRSGKPQGESGKAKGLARGKPLKTAKDNQKLFFELPQEKSAGVSSAKPGEKKEAGQKLPTQRQVEVSRDFSPEELQTISLQLRLGGAAAARHLRELGAGLKRDLGHGDPRPQDWIQADYKNFEFLVGELTQARRGRGYLDLTSLDNSRLIDLWEFCRFEAQRAHRNIDQLKAPGGGIGGQTADYLSNNYNLEARFFSHIAATIERTIPGEALDDSYLEEGDK